MIEEDSDTDEQLAVAPPSSHSPAAPLQGRDLAVKAHVGAISIWYRFGPVVVGGFLIVFLLDSGRIGEATTAEVITLLMITAILSCYFWTGRCLSQYSNAARITAAVFSFLGFVGCALMAFVPLDWHKLELLLAERDPDRRLPYIIGYITPFFFVFLSMLWFAAASLALVNSRAKKICTLECRKATVDRSVLDPKIEKSPFFIAPLVLVVFAIGFLLLRGVFLGSSGR